jgi:transglutaminase-like putative cysteine protease
MQGEFGKNKMSGETLSSAFSATRAYITVIPPKAGLLSVCELLLAIFTVISSLAAGNALYAQSSTGVLTVAAALLLTTLFFILRKGKKPLPVFLNPKIMLLLLTVIAVIFVFIFRNNIVAFVAGVMVKDCKSLLSAEDIKISAVVLGAFALIIIYYLQKYAKSVLLIILFSLIPFLTTLYNKHNTESITLKIGIIALVIAWIAQMIWQKNDYGNFFCHAIIFGIICMSVGIAVVYGLGIYPTFVIKDSLQSGDISTGEPLKIRIDLADGGKKQKQKWTEIVEQSEGVSNLLVGDGISFEGTVMLEAAMDFSVFDGSPVYLRHFFGADYDKTAWAQINDEEKRALSDIISQFSTQNLSPNNFDSFSFNEFTEYYLYETVTTPFDIRKVGMSVDTTFLPYFLDRSDDFFNTDGELINTGTAYSGTVLMPPGFYDNDEIVSNILLGASYGENPDLAADELLYRDFVYSTYMEVPQEFITQNPVFDENYMAYITSEETTSGKSTLTSNQIFARKVNYIHKWLRDNCEYEINVDATPTDKDYALYFLNESRKGFCQHFATSATLLCRAAGIPARYVTGFIIPEIDYKNVVSGFVEVSDSRAHAWTEIYVDGFGWMPVDFTPGYSNVRTSLTAEKREQQELASVPAPIAEAPVTTAVNVPTAPEKTISEPVPEKIPEETAEVSKEPRSGVFRVVLICAAVIVFILLVVFVRRRLMSIIHKRTLHSEKGFDYVLGRTKFILNAGGMPVVKLLSDRTAYLKTVEQSCYSFVSPILNTALSVKFGGVTLTEDEINRLNKLADRAILKYYRKQNLINRLKLKYILNIL